MNRLATLAPVRARLVRAALAYPEAKEEHPWGEQVIKVRGRIFVFCGLGADDGRLSITVKLPRSGSIALSLPFAQPCGYGLGKSGWVTARFARGDDVPEPLLLEWIEESWRAVAPKRLVAARDGGRGAEPEKKGKGKGTGKGKGKGTQKKKPRPG